MAEIDTATQTVRGLVLVGKRAWNVTLDKAEARLFVVNGLSDDLTVVDVATAKAIKLAQAGVEKVLRKDALNAIRVAAEQRVAVIESQMVTQRESATLLRAQLEKINDKLDRLIERGSK